MLLSRWIMFLLALCPTIAYSQELDVSRRSEPRLELLPAEGVGFIRYPLRTATGDGAHKLGIAVEVNGKPTIAETYSLPAGSTGKALVLRLDGARRQNFDALRARSVNARFTITVDGRIAETLTLDELLALHATAMALPRLEIASDVAVPETGRPIRHNVRTNDYFYCPENYQGECYVRYMDCLQEESENPCDPGKDPGCEQRCSQEYETCTFGQYIRSWNEEIEEPIYQDGYECGYYPWYEFLNYRWEKWWTKKTWRTVEERYCPTTQQYYQHVVSESVEYKWCYKQVNQGCDDGDYMGGECKL